MGAAYLKGPPAPPPTKAQIKCRSKMSYSSQKYARWAAKGRLKSPGCREVRLWVYECPECGQWHITKQQLTTRPEGAPLADDFSVVPG